jgi:hypothetical protein
LRDSVRSRQRYDLTRVTIRGADLRDMDISGQIDNVRINGVDVVPLVEAELDRRYPDRAKMRPGDAAGYREACDVLERLWQQTVARARQMDPGLLHRRVNGEWSFIETLWHRTRDRRERDISPDGRAELTRRELRLFRHAYKWRALIP